MNQVLLNYNVIKLDTSYHKQYTNEIYSSLETDYVLINDKYIYTNKLYLNNNYVHMNLMIRSTMLLPLNESIKIEKHQSANINQLTHITFKIKKLQHKSMNTIDKTTLLDFIYLHNLNTFFQQHYKIAAHINSNTYELVVKDDVHGILTKDTIVKFDLTASFNIKFSNNYELNINQLNPKSLGIGGLNNEVFTLFRKALNTRLCNRSLIDKLNITHTKGILLYGPPGTGKTLIARKLSTLLSNIKPKIINGPEIMDKYVGEAERKIREIFEDADNDYRDYKDDSDLHVIIFDEFDSICKKRGSSSNNTNDTIVNQLLTKIDGVNSLNNILIIALTNRKDMIDNAVLRAGRIETHIEIGLPDFNGRKDIIEIYTNSFKHLFDNDVLNTNSIAEKTKNFTGAEIESLIKNTIANSLQRKIDYTNLSTKIENIMITTDDIELALNEAHPLFSSNIKEDIILSILEQHQYGSLDWSKQYTIIEQLNNRLVLYYVYSLQDAYVSIITAEQLIGLDMITRCNCIKDTFEKANKIENSIIVVDMFEDIIGYVKMNNFYFVELVYALKTLIIKYMNDIKIIVLTKDKCLIENFGLVLLK
jgi:vesicle-fusing ATPase